METGFEYLHYLDARSALYLVFADDCRLQKQTLHYHNPKAVTKFSFAFLLLICSILSHAQILRESNLPIIIINTEKDSNTGKFKDIPVDPRMNAYMKIIYRQDGSRNLVSDQNTSSFLNFDGKISIEQKGSTSQRLDKKPYTLTILGSGKKNNDHVSLLGMPSDNDWILNALAYDSSLIRDYLSYDLARSMGEYAPRGVYCEVIVNDDYKGLYILLEKIKVGKDRVHIAKLSKEDESYPAITGGYIVKADKPNGDPVAFVLKDSKDSTVRFINHYPKPEFITPKQNEYINSVFNKLRDAMIAQNESMVDGYPSIIDVPNFINFMLINELASNVDGYQYSTYLHKDRNGKLRAGPVWDFNLTYGNDLFIWGYDRSHADLWQFDNNDNTGPRFWNDLYRNPTFRCQMAKRWKELTQTGQPLDLNVIYKKIEERVSLLKEATERESARWGKVGDHDMHIQKMKDWLSKRMNWMNEQLDQGVACPTTKKP